MTLGSNFIVYCHTNKVNGKRYVGWTSLSMEKRWNQHVYGALCRSSSYAFHKAIRKYGKEVWEHSELCCVSTLENVLKAEKFFIDELKTTIFREGHHGYNMTDGGEGTKGRVFSDKARRQIGLTRKRKMVCVGDRNPMFGRRGIDSPIFGEKNGFWGKSHTDEMKAKISEKQRGKRHSIESKKKMSKARKGVARPDLSFSKVSKDVQALILKLNQGGHGLAQIATILKENDFLTPAGNQIWDLRTIKRVLDENDLCYVFNYRRPRVSAAIQDKIVMLYSTGHHGYMEIRSILLEEGYCLDPRTIKRVLKFRGAL